MIDEKHAAVTTAGAGAGSPEPAVRVDVDAERVAKIDAERVAKIDAERVARVDAERVAKIDAERMDAVANLAGVIAHDFNNLLTIITGHAEMLLDAFDESTGVRRNALEIKNAADTAARISDQLLAISRKQAIAVRPSDINELVRSMTETLHQIAGHGIELWFDLDVSLPLVEVDERLLERVVRSIVASLRDGMLGRGRLRVSTRSEERAGRREVQLWLSDSRGHAAEESSRRAFEPVLDAARLGRGAGLALAAAYGIITQSGGELRSEPSSEGSRIVIALPVRPDPQTRLRW